MNKTVLGVTRLKLTANKFFIGLGIVIVLWGVIDSWLINQQQQLNGDRGYLAAFIFGPLTALILFGIHRLILKTKMMLSGDSHQWNIFADLLPWFVWVAVGLATWSVNEWYHPRPLSMTSPWDWMASLVVVGLVGWLGWVCINLFSASYSALYVFLNWLRTSQPPYLALISVGITIGLVCGFIGGVVGTALILSKISSIDRSISSVVFLGSFLGMLSIFVLLSRDFKDIRYWVRYSLWGVWLTSVFLMRLVWSDIPFNEQFWWQTTWFWSVPITGASVGLLGVLIFFNARSIELKTASKDEFMFFEQNPGDIRLKNQDNARCISLHLWWYRRRLTEWNPFWFTALVGIPLLSLFLISVPAVKELQMIQQVFAEEGSSEYRSRIELLDPAGMARKQFELEREQSPDWKKKEELYAKWNILEPGVTPQTEGQQLLCQALNKEIDEIYSKNRGVWYGKQWDLLQERVTSSWEDGPLSKQFEQKKSDRQAAIDAAFSKLMAYIWNQCSLGLGVGLVVDVMLLVGVAAWLNIRRSSKFPSSTQ